MRSCWVWTLVSRSWMVTSGNLPEGGIDPGKHICAALRRQADGQAVSAALDLVLQAVVGILPDEQDLPGGLQIDLTGFGGLPSAAGADEQRSMQLRFPAGGPAG